jgi:hypothetical protein
LAALWPSGHSPAASPAATSARFPIELLLAAGAGLVLLGLIGLTVVTVRRRRAAKRQGGHGVPWKSVVTLAKRGQPISLIARQTGLAQDAVRIVLAPIEAETVIDRGSSFRSGDRPDADAGSGPRLGRRA